jgi:hypothetical protein
MAMSKWSQFAAMFFVFSAALACPSLAEPPSEATSDGANVLLAKAKDAYKGLRSFHFERTTTIDESSTDGKPLRVADMKFISAAENGQVFSPLAAPDAKPESPVRDVGRFRYELASGDRTFLFLFDGKSYWTYWTPDKLYRKGDGMMSVIGSVPGPMLIGLHHFPQTALSEGALQKAKLVREENVALGKDQRKCQVIEAVAESPDFKALAEKADAAIKAGTSPKPDDIKPPLFMGLSSHIMMLKMQGYLEDRDQTFYSMAGKTGKAEPTNITLWLDTESHLLVRAQFRQRVEKLAVKSKKELTQAGEVELTMTENFTVLNANGGLPDSLFSFKPPAEAKEFVPPRAAQPTSPKPDAKK